MNNARLISRSKFTDETFPLPDTLSEAKLHLAILQAQESYLEPLIGSAMYYDLQERPDAPENKELMTGVTYTDKNGDTVRFIGLSYALCFWTAVRLFKNVPVGISMNGIVKRTSAHSEHMTAEEIAAQIADLHSMASRYWNKAQKFLNDKGATVYPLYFKANNKQSSSTQPVKISSIGGEGNSYNNQCNDFNY